MSSAARNAREEEGDVASAEEVSPMVAAGPSRKYSAYSPAAAKPADSDSEEGSDVEYSERVRCCCCGYPARVWYLGMLGLAFVVAIFFRYGLFGLLEHIGGFDSCGDRNSCVDVLAVFRVSFVMACFFAVHAVCFLPCIDAVGRWLHIHGFFVKFLALVGFLIGTLWISNDVFEAYGWVAMVMSAIFLVVQIVVLFDFAFRWSENWGQKAIDEGKNLWKWLILIVSFAMYAGGILITVLCFLWFTRSDTDTCGLNKFFVSMILVFGGIITTLTLLVEHAHLLPAALVFFNSSHMVWSGLYSSPAGSCNSINGGEDNKVANIVVGALFAAVSLLYTAFRISNSRKSLSLNGNTEGAQEGGEEKSNNFFFFHAIMACSSAYVAMLLTGWALNSITLSSSDAVARSMAAVWVKNVTMWVANLLYIWILVAPLVLKNRVFE